MYQSQFRRLSQIEESIFPIRLREIHDCIEFGKLTRQEYYSKDIEKLNEVTEELKLNYSVSKKSFTIPTDKGLEIWASTLEPCLDNDPNAMRLIYLHSDQSVCDHAKSLDHNDDDFNLGLLLQYPKCCIDAYCSWQTDNEDIDPITTITNANKYDGELKFYDFPNPFSRYFGLGLYSHFPCSLTCQQTKHMAKRSLDCLRISFPSVARRLIELESALVIFLKNEGIFIWKHFLKIEKRIKLNPISFQGQGDLKELFRAVTEIELTGNCMILHSNDGRKVEFRTENCFIGAFTYLSEPGTSER